MKFDQLRSAKYRLNAYRGMSSDAYISLSSKDQILTAFELSKELKGLARAEKYFKVRSYGFFHFYLYLVLNIAQKLLSFLS